MISRYDALIAFGHSPAQAANIVLDAKRKNRWARRWIAMVRRIMREAKKLEEHTQ